MIRYDLVCKAGHTFDGWFRDSAAFDAQAAGGALSCPACGSGQVTKAMMAPSLARGREPAPGQGRAPPAPQPGPAPQEGAGPLAPGERERHLRELARRLRRHVEENADYVGSRFPEEVRRMHYQETQARGIYGEATREETRDLLDEGIPVMPLPDLPDEHN